MKVSTTPFLQKQRVTKTITGILLGMFFMLAGALKTNAQYNTATVNGSIAGGEYGTHTDGQNQNTNGAFATLMSWDASNLYVAISGTGNNTGEAIVIYLDKDNLTPVDGGTNSNGTNVGNAYDGTNFAQLPFRADLVVYVKDGYNEYRTSNGANGWSTQTSGALGYSSSGTVQELSIPWSVIGGIPSSFNFFSYKTSSGGFVYAQQPTANAGATIGTTARNSYYYTVSSTANGSATKPFSRMSYVFNSTTSLTGFGAISVWDFTMNSGGGGTSITRATGAGGVWTISGNLVVASGTVDFGSSSNAANIGNLVMSGGTLTLSTASGGDLNLTGNFTKTGGTFNCNSRAVGFNGTTKQIYSSNATENVNFLSVTNATDSVVLASSVNLPAPATSANTLNLANNAKLGVRSGATITVNSAGAVLGNINFGGTGTRMNVEGTLKNVGTTTANTYTGVSATTLIFANGGIYEHNYTSTATGTIPTATWSTGSTCLITGYTSTAVTINSSFSQSFHHFTWNCTNQSVAINFLGLLTTVNGNLNFQSAGTGSLTYNSNSPAAPVLTIGGNFTVGASFNMNNGTSTPTFNIGGDFSQTGGTISRGGGGTVTMNFNKALGVQNFSQSGGSITAPIVMAVTGATSDTLRFTSSVNLGTGAGSLTVNSPNTVDFGASNVLSGSYAFSLGSGARLITGNTSGVSGSVTVTGTKTYNAAANYTFNGTSAQVTSTAVTSAANVNINNSAGVTLSSNTAITGTLSFSAGKLTTSAKTLTLSATPTGTSTSSYIVADATGTVTMNSVSTSKTIPVGTSTSYAPLTLTAGSATNYTAYVTSTLPCTPTSPAKAVNLAWVLTGSTAPSTVGFQWNSADQGGSFVSNGTMELGRYASACPYTVTTLGAAAGTNPNTVTASAGFATGTNTYVLANVNSLVLAAPTVTTTVAANTITDVSASSGGQTVTGSSLDSLGVVWSVSPTTPAIGSGNYAGRTNDGTTAANFTSSLTGLSPETNYNVRAYASNAAGTGYGNTVSFYTYSSPVTAQATSLSASASSSSQIDLSWTAATFPGSGATVKGYVLLRATSPNTPSLGNGNGAAPTAGANTTIVSSTIADNVTTASNTGLIANTSYNYLLIPYTYNGANAATYNYLTASAPTASATTNAGAPSVGATTAITSITDNSASSGGSGLTDGGSSITSKGVVWDVTTGATTTTNAGITNDGTGTGNFSSSLTSLNPQTQYYVRAYANNGTVAYGNELSFYTLSAPVATQASSLSATVGGSGTLNLSWTGASFPGSGATQAGYVIAYATSPNTPSLSNTNGAAPSVGANTTIISSSATTLPTAPATTATLSGLTGGATYNFIVIPYTYNGANAATYNYLTASAPTASATAIVDPSVTTTAASIITTGGASSGGSSINAGGGTVSAKGVVYDVATNATPTLATNLGYTLNGSGTTSYSSSITSLNPETQYNYRAYVTNDVSTAYGAVLSFYTLSNEPTAQASALSATATSSTNINLSWTGASFPGSGATATGYVLLRATSPNTPSLASADGAAPSAGANTTIISSVISGAATTASDATAAANTTYNYLLVPYAYNGANAATYNYLTTSAPTASATTLAATAANQPTAITFSAVTSSTITTGWTAATGTPAAAGYIVLRGAGVTPNTDPVPGTVYTAGNTLGNATVAYVGTGVSTGAQTGLLDGTTYNYKIYSYTGSGAGTNYLLTSPLSGSQATSAISAPTATAATSVNSSSFTANWGAVSGAASYQLDVFTLNTQLSENFSGFITSGGTTDRSATLDTYTQTPGWTGTSVFENAGQAKLGTASVLGSLITPGLNLSGNGGATTLTFDLGRFGTDATIVQVFLSTNNGSTYTQVGADITAPASITTQTIAITGANSTSKIKIAAKTASNQRFYLDNILLQYTNPVSGYTNLSVSGTSQSVTGLSANTNYGYVVRAVGANSTSANSNTISALTLNDIATADFRTKASGNYSDTATWEYNSTGTTWTAARAVPAATNNVTIQAAHTIVLDASQTVNSGKTITVNGVLNTGSNSISGTGNFTLASGGTLGIGHASGIGSNIAVSGTTSFSSAASYVFNGTANQSTGTWTTTPTANTVATYEINNSGNTVTKTSGASITASTLKLTAGTYAIGSTDTIKIASAGSVTATSGSLASGSNGGVINFNGSGTVSGTVTFNNVFISGAVNFGTASTIGAGGSLRINTGGSVSTNAPTYSSTSTLVYNSGTTYGRSTEWSANSGKGYPGNVTIQNGTTVTWGNPGTDLGIAGNLNLGATGSAGSLTIQNGNKIIVAGDVTIGSNTGTSTLTLSSTSGGDIKVGGNWTRTANGAFSPATRAVFFTGSGTNVINSSGGASFDYLVSEKTGGSIQLGSNLTVNAPGGGNTLSLKSAASFDLNGFTLSLTNNVASNIQADGGVVNFIGGSGSTINVTSATKTITSINSGSVVFGSNVTITTSTGLNFGAGLSTVNGIFQINGGGFVQTNAPNYADGSFLVYNANYNRSGEWVSGSSGAGVPFNVTVNSGITLTMNIANTTADTRTLRGSLLLNGSMTFGGNGSGGGGTVGDLTIGANLTINNGATLTLGNYDGTNGNDIFISGNWTRNSGGTFVSNNRAITFQGSGNSTISTASASTFSYLFINKTGGATVNLANDLTVSANLTFTSGTITTGSNKVIIPSGSGVSRTSGHVNGNLQMYVGNSTSAITYHIGDASNYTPLSITFSGTSGTGSVIASTTVSDHPNIGTSTFNSSKTVNRYWSLTNSGVTYSSYDATFNFVSGDLDAGVSTSALYAGKYDPTTWTYPTVSNRTSTSVSVSGVTSMSDYQLGECVAPSVSTSQTDVSCYGGNNGTITVTATGGSAPYTYSINGGSTTQSSNVFSGLTSGTYTVTVIANGGCTATAGVTITQPAQITSSTNVTICSNQTPYNWNGSNYSTTGSYTYTVTGGAANGCDSVATLNLTVNAVGTSASNVTVCSNATPYTWNGNNYSTSGTYTYTVTGGSANGCDSIATLNLTVNAVGTSTSNVTICSNQTPYTWNGNNYSTSGTYTYTVTGGSANGCDSIATLNLTVNATSSSTTNVTVCSNATPYTWNGNNYSTSGTYTYTTTNAAGCDSVATLNLTVNTVGTSTSNVTICSNATPYTWNGNNYSTSGTYTYTVTGGSANGCDSVATLNLTVNAVGTSTSNVTICSNQTPYTWNGNNYSTGGTYTYTVTGGSANGCDSVATLNLTVNATSTGDTTAVANGSFSWYGNTYTSSGNYTHTFVGGNAAGCDSVLTLHLTITTTTYGDTTATACESFSWYGNTYTTSGDYTHTLTGGNSQGADSVITLHLTINYGTHNSESQTACDSYTWHGTTYTTSGDYTYSYTNGSGCASVDTLHLTVNYSTHNSDTQTACDSYTWHGTAYTTSGDYTYSYTNGNGCASVDTLHLTVNYSTHNSETQAVCNSYTWHGTTYTSSGDYTYSYTNGSGCASVDTLHLTINTGTFNAETQTVCDSYTWHGTTYTTSGDYTYSYANGSGCASVDTLHLTVNYSTHNSETQTVCDSYTWHGTTYATSGDYTYSYTNGSGCASVDTLHLTVNYSTHNSETQAVCDSYTWHGTTYTSSGTYTYSYTNGSGCASVDTLHLTINTGTFNAQTQTACDSYTWHGTTYTTSGDYTYSYTNGSGCASVDTLHLTINASTHNSNTQTACDSYTWHGTTYTSSGTYTYSYTNGSGCASVDTLYLTINASSSSSTSLTVCFDQIPYTWNGLTFNSAGTQTAHLTNAAGCDSAATLVLSVNNGVDWANLQWPPSGSICEGGTYTIYGQVYEPGVTPGAGAGTGITVEFGYSTTNSNPSGWTNWSAATYNTESGNNDEYYGTFSGLPAGTYYYTFRYKLNSCGWQYGGYSSGGGNFWDGTTYVSGVLTANASTHNSDTQAACNSYTWHGTTYTSSGTYTYSYTNGSGCASVDTLHLTINTGTFNAETQAACNSYTWHGTTYTSSGTYTYSYTNGSGCASTDTLHLTINTGTFNAETQTACNSYTWHSTTYTSSGTYTYSYTNGSGCASTDTLHLTINTGTFNAETQTACNSYTWHGTAYTSSGTYTYSYTNGSGCASTDTLHLTVNVSSTSTTSITASNSYTWNSTTYTTSGTYTYTTTNAVGCDSVATLVLTINLCDTTYSTTDVTICSSQAPYTWNGNNYSTSGTYTYTTTNAGGCDSIATLNLTVNAVATSTANVTVCTSSLPYVWNGNNYSTSGTYTYTVTNGAANGCDSVATLNLTVNVVATSTTNVTICSNQTPYNWNSGNYGATGTYTYIIGGGAANGCDSIATLNLTVNATSSSTTNVAVCANALPYVWNGNNYSSSGTYTYTTTNAVGCDSVATLNLTVKPVATSTTFISTCNNQLPYNWNGNNYTVTGTYTYTMYGSAANGCDSVATLELTVGDTSTSSTSVSVCAAQLPYSWNSNSYGAAGTFVVHLANAAGCDSAATLILSVYSAPAVPDTIIGTKDVCPYMGTSTQLTYYTHTVSGATSYLWSVPVGATIVSGQGDTAILVTFDNTFNGGDITVSSQVGCAISAARTMAIAKYVPTMPAAVNGPTNVCIYMGQATTAKYYITAVQYATSYTWTVPANATIVSGQGTDTIYVSYASNFSSGSVTCKANANCGSSSPRSLNITKSAPGTPSAISGPTNSCIYNGTGTPVTYSISPVSNAITYRWTLPANTTLVSATPDSLSVTITFNANFATGTAAQRTIKVKAISGCGNSADRSLAIGITIPATPGPITGPSNVCAYVGGAGGNATYTIRKVANANSYVWTVPSFATIVSYSGGGNAADDTGVVVSFNSSFVAGSVDSIKVQAVSTCGTSLTRALALKPVLPSIPGPITGSTDACPYMGTGDTVIYTIRKVTNATSYLWTLPVGMDTVPGYPTNDTILYTKFNPFFINSFLTVRSVSGCGTTPAARSITISKKLPVTPALISGTNDACPLMGTASTTFYTIRKVNYATTYTWTVPTGASIVSHPGGSGANDTIIEVSYSNSFSTGAVTVKANANCGSSGTRSLTIMRKIPSTPATITGTTDACPLMGTANTTFYTIRKVTNATYYNWAVPSGANIVSHPGGSGVNDTIIEVSYDNSFTSGNVSVQAANNCWVSAPRVLLVTRKLPMTPLLITAGTPTSCPGRQVTYTISAVTNATYYLWTVPSGATIVSGDSTTSIVVQYPDAAVSDTIRVQAGNNCTLTAQRKLKVTLSACPPVNSKTVPVAIVKPAEVPGLDVQVMSNPTQYQFSMIISSDDNKTPVNMQVTDMRGRVVEARRDLRNGQSVIAGENYQQGVYFAEFTQGKLRKVVKLIKLQ